MHKADSIKPKIKALAIIFAIVVIQVMLLIFPNDFLGVYFNILRPIFFCMLGFFCFIFISRDLRIYEIKSDYLLISVFAVLIYLFVMFALGYYNGFDYNPMNMSFWGILTNCWAFLSIAVIREYIRSKVTAGAKWGTLIFTALAMTFSSMDNLKVVLGFEFATIIDYILTVLLPLLVLNIFMTYTAYSGGLLGNLIFMTIYQAIPILSPVLPSIPKIFEAIMIYILVFIMFILVERYKWTHNKKIQEPVRQSWLLMPAAVLGVLILFGLGVFPYIPVAVATNSMKDEFSRGALVIIRKINNIDEIHIGDIIEYQSNSIAVIHRVVEISETSMGGKQFITKGDNNPSIDLYPVNAHQIAGVAQWHIPYLGYPALIFEFIK